MSLTLKTYVPKPRDARKAEAWNKINMLEGNPPHNTWSNICYGDGYFAQSIIRDFGEEAGATTISGIKDWIKKGSKS